MISNRSLTVAALIGLVAALIGLVAALIGLVAALIGLVAALIGARRHARRRRRVLRVLAG